MELVAMRKREDRGRGTEPGRDEEYEGWGGTASRREGDAVRDGDIGECTGSGDSRLSMGVYARLRAAI